MLLSFKKASLGIILVLALLSLTRAEDDDDKKAEKEEEEKDPWDKSTDKYRHKLGDSGIGSHAEEPVKIDVTEVSESEVHSERSKVCKNCKLKTLVARKAPSSKTPPATATATATGASNATKDGKEAAEAQYFNKNDVDDETKEQINDATDEKDPAEATSSDTKTKHRHHKHKHHHKKKKQKHAQASKKQLNPQIDYYPGNVWEYPYPYHHDITYGCGENDQNCDAKIEAKEEAKEQGNLESLLFPNDAKATPIPQEAKIESAVPPNESALPALTKPVATDKEPIGGTEPKPVPQEPPATTDGTDAKPDHPNAADLSPEPVPKITPPIPIEAKGIEGKGIEAKAIEGKGIEGKQDKKSKSKKKAAVGRLPNHGRHKISEIGASWETPCFYNADTKKFTCRQLIPAHYYGPPSAGWGGFQPGHTGGGWGTPHWNKRCHTPRLNCKSYTRQPSRSSWFFYNPRERTAWDPAAYYRYKGVTERGDADMQGSMRYKVSRPEDTINRITPLVAAHPGMRNNIGALHQWISFLETEREKDRELERYRLQMKDKENQRRYNLDVLRYEAAQNSGAVQGLHALKPAVHRGSAQIQYYSKLPQLEEQQNYEKKAIDYVLHHSDGVGTGFFNE